MKTPLVTVIMPVYNAADSVGLALRSVLDTHRKDEIEILVVDDCSSDATAEIVSDSPNQITYNAKKQRRAVCTTQYGNRKC
jgi:glycosyltransferase involved in cell wall biosynthesis